MSTTLVRDLIDSGIHFGHQSSRWNPKMAPYIFGKRNLIHIIDVRETVKGLLLAKRFISQIVAGGKDVLFVGTKRQARKILEDVCAETGMHYVNDRWLGGTLTNFRIVRSRIARLEELEKAEAAGTMGTSKKEAASHRRELRKITRNLGGIRNMDRLPGVLFVVDQRREIIAIKEAQKLGIPTVCLLDTDSDPDMVEVAIPGNDDSMRAIELVVQQMGAAIAEGKANRAGKGDIGEMVRPRSRRPAAGRAQEPTEATEAGEPGLTERAEQAEQPVDQTEVQITRPDTNKTDQAPLDTAEMPTDTREPGA